MKRNNGSKYDESLKDLYRENDYPLDRMLIDEVAADGFAKEFEDRIGIKIPKEFILGRLEYIRKTKRSTGGLPRLGRSWHGPRFGSNN